ncbi:MAG: hypothetical protein E6J25_07735 [Chloroflexi bacterium]|nr:MAG: hypothetical protein E6J25_07735 [Chloroflexota bacterium]
MGREAKGLRRLAHVEEDHILVGLVLEQQVAAPHRPLDGEARGLRHEAIDYGFEWLVLGERRAWKEQQEDHGHERQRQPLHHPITPIRPLAGTVLGRHRV